MSRYFNLGAPVKPLIVSGYDLGSTKYWSDGSPVRVVVSSPLPTWWNKKHDEKPGKSPGGGPKEKLSINWSDRYGSLSEHGYTAPPHNNFPLTVLAADSPSASGALLEDSDTMAASAEVLVAASSAVTESADSMSASAEVLVTATPDIVESGDSMTAAAEVLVEAYVNVTQSGDTFGGRIFAYDPNDSFALIVASTLAVVIAPATTRSAVFAHGE